VKSTSSIAPGVAAIGTGMRDPDEAFAGGSRFCRANRDADIPGILAEASCPLILNENSTTERSSATIRVYRPAEIHEVTAGMFCWLRAPRHGHHRLKLAVARNAATAASAIMLASRWRTPRSIRRHCDRGVGNVEFCSKFS
jgi:hypothetical protein